MSRTYRRVKISPKVKKNPYWVSYDDTWNVSCGFYNRRDNSFNYSFIDCKEVKRMLARYYTDSGTYRNSRNGSSLRSELNRRYRAVNECELRRTLNIEHEYQIKNFKRFALGIYWD